MYWRHWKFIYKSTNDHRFIAPSDWIQNNASRNPRPHLSTSPGIKLNILNHNMLYLTFVVCRALEHHKANKRHGPWHCQRCDTWMFIQWEPRTVTELTNQRPADRWWPWVISPCSHLSITPCFVHLMASYGPIVQPFSSSRSPSGVRWAILACWHLAPYWVRVSGLVRRWPS